MKPVKKALSKVPIPITILPENINANKNAMVTSAISAYVLVVLKSLCKTKVKAPTNPSDGKTTKLDKIINVMPIAIKIQAIIARKNC